MKIQSLSVVVPGKGCINNCQCCVSKMSADNRIYKNQLEENLAFYDLYLNDYIKRLEFCRDNGCNTLMLTGNIEPQQNKRFLADFGMMMRLMRNPFRNIEMQTTFTLCWVRQRQIRQGTDKALLLGKTKRVRRIPETHREAGMKETLEYIVRHGLELIGNICFAILAIGGSICFIRDYFRDRK